MSADPAEIAIARANADAARARLMGTLGQIQSRLAPRNLAEDAWEKVRDHGGELAGKALQGAKEKPVRTAAIIGAVALFFARKPIIRGVTNLLNGDGDETD
ncbi:hypothetical protein ACFB49_20700 [Sphingomonas sp. DBB INV C78]|uniref:DUF3618 domain-containing protein n=1 Tax=Sphingomonas sp. DBB INV C78 TaxID=3349434 RepID=UPI0036D231AA